VIDHTTKTIHKTVGQAEACSNNILSRRTMIHTTSMHQWRN